MVRVAAVGLIGLFLSACDPAGQPVRPATFEAIIADPAWDAEVDRYLAINVQPSDPLEGVIWRGVRCDFLAGEVGGDQSAQDRAITARMIELRCGEPLLAEVRSLRAVHGNDSLILARLDALLDRGD